MPKADRLKAKADHQEAKRAEEAQAAEAKQVQSWQDGAKSKGKGDERAQKARDALVKKAERDRLLAEEEAASAKTLAKAPKPAAKKSKPAAVPGFDAAPSKALSGAVPEYSASGIDDALDALTIATEKTDKASQGARAAVAIDSHPERRFKAAFQSYSERNLPQMRKDYPGLRFQQYHDRLYESFKKSEENPFNQAHVAYDAGKSDKLAALEQGKAEREARLRTE